ncbi:alpha/beta hydrolase [Corynebacterium sp.]|uniref:alpha/beta hydrolase n=1 Tax=Corynebacterium sp. TaxID=1720 RepID=UPI0025BB2E47|nr:alpha/beta hydrolase [Corynebacterium sp.]
MSRPILLFLHGVGQGDPDGRWRTALEPALQAVGYSDLSGVRVIAPRYADALHGVEDDLRMPPLTVKEPARKALRDHRRDFEQRVSAMEQLVGRHTGGRHIPLADAVINVAVGVPNFAQARNYLADQRVRAGVLTRILEELPGEGRILIVGHSLGSVIAADLVRRLPVGLEVTGLVTVGSPLTNQQFDVDKLRQELAVPPTNLAWWVNFWSPSDPVAALRGVSSVFPWVLDQKVATTPFPGSAHSSREYLASPAVATAIGYALFGSRSRELDLVSRGVDITLDSQERDGLQALRYAHLISERMKGDEKQRYLGALAQVQAGTVAEIRARAHRERRPVAAAIAELDVDLTDMEKDPRMPDATRHLSREEAVTLLVTLAEQNLLAPFEINVDEKIRKLAMEDLTEGMGLGSSFGTDVFEALDEAADVLRTDRGRSWVKWGLVGVGAIALTVATGGLALTATPGLAGAAAITSALAGFGPGGMIGGLLTAGTLVSAGTTGIAVGVLSPATSAESVESLVKSQLALVILRARHHLEADDSIWLSLTDTERVLRRERARLAEFSDPRADIIVELDRKLRAVDAALAYMSRNNLSPVPTPDAGETQQRSLPR